MYSVNGVGSCTDAQARQAIYPLSHRHQTNHIGGTRYKSGTVFVDSTQGCQSETECTYMTVPMELHNLRSTRFPGDTMAVAKFLEYLTADAPYWVL